MQRLVTTTVRARSGPVGLRWIGADGATGPRVAYAVSRRQGSAVVRNRMRRRVRSIVAECAAAWPPGDYLISLEASVATMAYEELREHVKRAQVALQR